MAQQDVVSKAITIQILNNSTEAPKYTEETRLLKLHTCIIVGNGTKSGKPTVDLQMTDADGNKYIVMTTGALLESMGCAAKGKRQRDEGESHGTDIH